MCDRTIAHYEKELSFMSKIFQRSHFINVSVIDTVERKEVVGYRSLACWKPDDNIVGALDEGESAMCG